MSHFAKALESLLEKHDWSQRVFGEMTGLEQNEVSNYVRGKHHVRDVEKLRRILSAAGNDDRELLLAYIQDRTPEEFHSRIRVEKRR